MFYYQRSSAAWEKQAQADVLGGGSVEGFMHQTPGASKPQGHLYRFPCHRSQVQPSQPVCPRGQDVKPVVRGQVRISEERSGTKGIDSRSLNSVLSFSVISS